MEVHETQACNDTTAAAVEATVVVDSTVEAGDEEMVVVTDNEPSVTATTVTAAASVEQSEVADEEVEGEEEEDMYVGASLRALFNMLPANGVEGQGQDSAAAEGDDSQWLQDEVTNRLTN